MKKSNFFKWGLLTCAAIFTLNSCSFGEDEKGNEIVDDPMKDTEVYYIDGIVYDTAASTDTQKAVLAGVEVKIGEETATTDNNGVFKFVVNSKKEYLLEFAKSGYIGVDATATIAADAVNRSMVTLGIKMTPISTSASVTPLEGGEAKDRDDDEYSVHIAVPPGAAPSEGSISVTPYDVPVPASTNVKVGQETIVVPLKNLAITATHNEYQESLTVTIRNIGSDNAYFDPDEMEIWHNNQDATTRAASGWVQETSTIKFGNGNYDFQTNKLKSKYTLEIKTLKNSAPEKNTEYNLVNGKNEVKVDNSGNTNAIKNYVIKVEAKAGWEYTTSPAQALNIAGVTGDDAANMVKTINSVIEAQEGGFPGYYTVTHEMTANISGNHIMYYRNMAKFSEKTYTFDIVVKGNKNTQAVVKLKAYTGREDYYQNVDATQHSGGAI